MKIVLSSKAKEGLHTQAVFWVEKEDYLGVEFYREFQGAIQTIVKSPNGYFCIESKRGIRRFYEKRFHTLILYEYLEEQDTLKILVVCDARMNPKTIFEMLGSS